MAKQKFKFDPTTLSYREEKRSFAKKALNFLLTQFTLSVVIAALLFMFAFTFIDSPKEKQLRRENDKLRMAYTDISGRLDRAEEVLAEVQDRDNNIYRAVFEAEKIPTSVREAGIGGVDRYKKYENLRHSEIVVDAAKRVDKISKQLVIQSKSYDEIVNLLKTNKARLAAIPAIQPIAISDLRDFGSSFGWRMHPIYKVMKMHEGVDLSAPTGTSVYAAGGGKVETAEWSRGYGQVVVINHGFGYKTVYAHLSAYKVRAGQKVERGQIIGAVGSTGVSTSPHLHYEVHINGKPVNPINFYVKDVSPEEYDVLVQKAKQKNQTLD